MRKYGNFIIFLVRFFVGVRGIILLLLDARILRKGLFFYTAPQAQPFGVLLFRQ